LGTDADDRIANPWGRRTPHGAGEPWPERVDLHLADGVTEDDVERWVPSASVLSSNGDAMDIAVAGGRIVGVRGRPGDRVNRGRLGPKDLFGWRSMASPDRLTTPLVRRGGRLVPVGWDEAMGLVVGRSRALLADPGGWGRIGFYTSGQLFLEEYYTLAVIGKAGIGTPHMDGNTRLCTATAAAALKASFGTDGQPGSYADVDDCDAIALWGHNVAETQTVLWSRMLDRRRGADPPRILAVDPRDTPVAREADVHLAPRIGTNLMLVNALILQGFYQSHQATAASCAVNDIHLLRGMIGRPGAGVLQMNGQPTAQNTRETGADGDLPGFRNWDNEEHVRELADLWKVDPGTIPHWAPPTHAMSIWRYAEQGSVEMLWISGTNPAVSLPDLGRIRGILSRPELFLVVQDLFLTETARLADVVLPAAGWGEKTGTFTNVDRTVHISDRAVDPPGEARSDLEIWLDYARRMGFRNRDGDPLIPWTGPEDAFEAWKACSHGRPCDYSGLTYERLREGGVQWPCTEDAPDGTERLYTAGRFNTDSDYAETFGHDLDTGASHTETEHRARRPGGRAILQATAYRPPDEAPDPDHPLLLTTGRTVYHFHTRTKTARAPELQAAAPEVWAELSEADAAGLGVREGDRVRIASRRGSIEAPARIGGIRSGHVFVPFHYGYWDRDAAGPDGGPGRAANELVRTHWDPVSKQPLFKVGAVSVTRVEG
jgi:ferredoxin-nitrate reductase